MVRWLCASAVPDMPYFPLSLCRMARACLNLMAAMVTQGPEAARDVCSHFDLNKKTLYTLATKRDSKVRSPEHPPSPMCFLSLQRAERIVRPPLPGLGPHTEAVGGLYGKKRGPRQPLEPGRKDGLTAGQRWGPGHLAEPE